MDIRSIGIFDSGLGGLTALKEIRKALPMESIVYFGDTGRIPYGTRSRDTIVKYARQDVRFLSTFDLKAIVVACGTVSSVALPSIAGMSGLPILGVIDSAVKAASRATRNGKIGVIGTTGTILSGSYEKGLREMDKGYEIFSKACPLFVPLVEAGKFETGYIPATLIAEEYLLPMVEQGIDTLIMGCTHYPLMEGIIKSVCGDGVTMINPGAEISLTTAALLREKKLLCTHDCHPVEAYYVSDSVEQFERLAAAFLGGEIRGLVKQIDIENY